MVEIEYFDQQRADGLVGRIVLRADGANHWRSAFYILATLFTISITIGLTFALYGFWPILPFSLLELSALGTAIWWCQRRATAQQVISISSEDLIFEAGYRTPSRRETWQRFYTNVTVSRPTHPWRSRRVTVRHRQEEVELGEFLTDAEKGALVKALQTLIGRANARLGSR